MSMEKVKKHCSILRIAIIVLVIAAQAFQLNYSAMPSFAACFGIGLTMIFLNTLVIATVNLLLRLLFRRWETVLTITSVVFLLWSVANYYVSEYHGNPLFISEFMSIRAAADVMGGYHYEITNAVIGLLLVFAVELIMIVLLRFPLRKYDASPARGRWVSLALFIVSAAAVYLCLLSPISSKPKSTMGLSWYVGVKDYGFISCTIEDATKLLQKYQKPDGYEPSAISVSGDTLPARTEDYPDVILILNETFFDLNHYTDVLDEDLFLPLRESACLCMGYAAAPGIGGTNNAEYELLTSNSSKLLAFSAPFSFLQLDKTKENVICQFNQLGYETYGMHCCNGVNYSRNTAYPTMGFQHVLLGKESFPRYTVYGNRPWLDADNFLDLIDYYEAAGDAPRFMYMLTFQNHGGYEQNPPEYDTVHTNLDYGDLTDDVDEFLTSVSKSVDAFSVLTEYFSQVDRNVIVCMVGDHAPSFISDLPAMTDITDEEAQIVKRLTPYIIWANYDVELPAYTEYVSMVDLVPMVLKTAGLPLTVYYQYILGMHEELPVRLYNGLYMDRAGNIGTYEESSPYYDMMTQYYYMEYNALEAGNDYRKDLFEWNEDSISSE